ncbi:CDP-alcohol phosphatidyltransferase family protein [Actinomadura spongiicola]|uniref:CDP-alcohol phosphatidyltransferase family protein n=2 Tax=Actinomadura spongiicola TaxID=2303421 RepID=A0A372GBT2_9ACTN|nr:CDP-alcohol phosphatidyltransferase family protein [Actinomadura spongiicola]
MTAPGPVGVGWRAAAPPSRSGPRVGRGVELAIASAAQVVLLVVVRPGLAGLAVGVGYALAAWAVLSVAFRRRRALAPADHVTLTRVVLTGGVTALVTAHLLGGGHTWTLVAVASTALVLDGVDGRVARRTGTASRFGARFDMEVDAFLVLVLSVHVAWTAGAWVLTIGAMRYVFGAAARVAPWLRADLRPSLARKAVAVVQGVTLVAAASGVVPYAEALVAAALALLLWSFGRDVAWLSRRAWSFKRGRSTDGAGRPSVLDPVAR